jgi:ATP-dependent DNA helicase RecQ
LSTPIQILAQYWHHSKFRPQQEEIINSVLAGNDTLALLPTGGGKSVCFQVPALLLEGTCLVISPLIALMRDQVSALHQKGIKAVAIHSGLKSYEVKRVLQDVSDEQYKFLYCSPERLESSLFLEMLPALSISLIVIDEAHCISQWGYDFRPPYLRIAAIKKLLPQARLIAVTASATTRVQEDIIAKLELKATAVFRQSFERPNISYSNFLVESKPNKIIDILQKVGGTGIVYCNNRRQTKKIADILLATGIAADYYHAGLTQEIREQKQQAWISNKIRVMVCTNAFGMGIDKPDVRTVIHHDIPDCLENYYQEAGRAGRDGKRAYAVLVYQQKDIIELMKNAQRKFPTIKVIREVYQAIADYLQIPVGIGEGIYYDFDISVFIKRFKLEAVVVMNVLKVLEQEGHIQFAENIFLPSQVNFACERTVLENFEREKPALEPIIKGLLRTYEGIFNDRVSVYESVLAKNLRLDITAITNGLEQLAAAGIIEYLPRKDTPQIQFLLNRAPAQYLHIQQDAYLARKKRYQERIDTIIQYATKLTTCRSNFIGKYFGDTNRRDCGICDNCLTNKKKKINSKHFAEIEARLKVATEKNINKLINTLAPHSSNTVWEVLYYLQSENKLIINDDGDMEWN